MTTRNEVFDKITVQGLVFDKAGSFPPQNSILTTIDSKGTADFRQNVNCENFTITNNLVAFQGNINNLTVQNANISNLVVNSPGTITVKSNITVNGDGNTSGYVKTPNIILVDAVTDISGSLTYSGSLNWNGTNIMGWKPVSPVPISLLTPTATNADIITTVNSLLDVFKTQGVFIT
jgi:hypothetical protein